MCWIKKLIFAFFPLFVTAEQTKYLKLQVIQHQPCSKIEGNHIEFANSRTAQFRRDTSRNDGWYILSGPVKVHKAVSGPVYMYVETKNGSSAQPIPCEKSENGCGGVGSCKFVIKRCEMGFSVYCNLCQASKQNTQQRSRGQVEIVVDGEKLDCNKKLSVGEYRNVTLTMQAPEMVPFLKSAGIEKQAWDDLIGERGTTIFMTMYLFAEDVSRLTVNQLRYKASKFDNVIACHRCIVNISSDK